jgi:hypothetical protein
MPSDLKKICFSQGTYKEHVERRANKSPTFFISIEKRGYPLRVATEKEKLGEDNLREIAYYTLLDLKKLNKEKFSNALIEYVALMCNLFVHNSSYFPAQGFGKTQLRELKQILQYYRSQLDHPHRLFFDNQARDENSKGQRGHLPRNTVFEKILTMSQTENIVFKNTIQSLDEYGFKLAKQESKATKSKATKITNFGPLLGYTGARANNNTAYIMALKKKCNSIDELRAAIILLISQSLYKSKSNRTNLPPQKQLNCALMDIRQRGMAPGNDWLKKFEELKNNIGEIKLTKNLFHQSMNRRIGRVGEIIRRIKTQSLLNSLAVRDSSFSTCLEVVLYPSYRSARRASQNFTQGITNVILGFFGGLLNFNLHKRGLFIFVQKRQSFGFSNPTLTDIDNGTIRLSLGNESTIFDDILVETICELAIVMKVYDFTNKENESVKRYLGACEKPKNQKTGVTEKTGNHLLNAMRKDENQWYSIICAYNNLMDRANSPEGTDIIVAFGQYLEQITKGVSSYEDNISFKLDNSLYIRSTSTIDTAGSNLTAAYLNNVLTYTLNYVTNMEKDAQDYLIRFMPSSYAYLLRKLWSNCYKIKLLLEAHTEASLTHFIAKGNLLIENILEYLILLNGQYNLFKRKDHIKNSKDDEVKALKNFHLKQASCHLEIPENQIEVFYTDSGQQANVASLLILEHKIALRSNHESLDIHVYNNTYYEFGLFLKEIRGFRNTALKDAYLVVLDVRSIKSFEADLEQVKNLNTIIIDITHNSVLGTPGLKDLIVRLHQQKKWVILTTSSLKHEQLGLDKYQCGRITVIKPLQDDLYRNIRDELQQISDGAMTPNIAYFLNVVNKVSNGIE